MMGLFLVRCRPLTPRKVVLVARADFLSTVWDDHSSLILEAQEMRAWLWGPGCQGTLLEADPPGGLA